MRIYKIIKNLKYILLFICICCGGCDSQKLQTVNEKENRIYSQYTPVTVEMTSLSGISYDDKAAKIKAYVSLKDAFASQIKSPAVFRFELYQKIAKMPEPKGKRVMIWPDVDITDLSVNNQYWREYLRCYEFEISTEALDKKDYVLQVMCRLPGGKILFADYTLKPK
jgi:hypothetical protein